MNRRHALNLMGATAVAAATGALIPSFAAAQETAESGIVEMTLGSDDAPITLVEYASFTCPHCATFHNNVLTKIKAEYVDTGKVKFVYRDVYFDRPGLWAGLVARCDPAKFFGISDLLYADQKAWIGSGDPAGIVQNLRKIGRIAGLTEDQLDTCLSDGERAQTLYTWYQDNAKADEIDSTPTLFINDVKHSNMSYDELKALLDKALDEA